MEVNESFPGFSFYQICDRFVQVSDPKSEIMKCVCVIVAYVKGHFL